MNSCNEAIVLISPRTGTGIMNIDTYRKDLDALIAKGRNLRLAMMRECNPEQFESFLEDSFGDDAKKIAPALPSFIDDYQSWYSESQTLIMQFLPNRLSDFTRYYEKPKSRKELTAENYSIEDYLQGLRTTDWKDETVVGPAAAIPLFLQQLSILKAIQERFRSSLFDIRQMTQADIFDSELDAAEELAKNKFGRAAGVVAGVVLERHLSGVCASHNITLRKKSPQISDLNEALKKANVIDTPQWRQIQYLADVRNICAHNRQAEPTAEQVKDILDGVTKVTKTVF